MKKPNSKHSSTSKNTHAPVSVKQGWGGGECGADVLKLCLEIEFQCFVCSSVFKLNWVIYHPLLCSQRGNHTTTPPIIQLDYFKLLPRPENWKVWWVALCRQKWKWIKGWVIFNSNLSRFKPEPSGLLFNLTFNSI